MSKEETGKWKRGLLTTAHSEVLHLPVTEKETKPREKVAKKLCTKLLHRTFSSTPVNIPKKMTNKTKKEKKKKHRAWSTLSHRENQRKPKKKLGKYKNIFLIVAHVSCF